MQCPFCLFRNVVGLPNPLCGNCGLDMARLLALQSEPAAAIKPAEFERIVPLAPPAPGKDKKSRSSRKRVKSSGPRPDVATRSVASESHSSLAPNVAPSVAMSGPPASPISVSHVAPPPATFGLVQEPPLDESLEATVFASVAPHWVLEFADGTSVALPGDNIVIGRQPTSTEQATPLPIPDPTRTLSRTHAILRRDATDDTWSIRDLGSANGVATVGDTGVISPLASGDAVAATEYLLVGTLKARLTRLDATRHVNATPLL